MNLSISEFNYELPDASVAKYPLHERDQSKLLCWEEGAISDHHFADLPSLLPEGSMLVFNNTRVIHARLHFVKSTGALIEVFCLEPTDPRDYVHSFAQTSSCRWKCIVGNLKRWKGEVLRMEVAMGNDGETEGPRDGAKKEGEKGRGGEGASATPGIAASRDVACNVSENLIHSEKAILSENLIHSVKVILSAELMGELEGGFEIRFSWDNPEFAFAEILEAAGNIPIPPYLHRASEEIDLTVYQTVYAKIKGSVAAPTAGLHFTPRVLESLDARQISCEELTLHVGAGTFQPVKSDTIGGHQMHTEHFTVSRDLIERLMHPHGGVVAVGTTSVRTLESLYWIGCKIAHNPLTAPDQLPVSQWEPYREVVGHIEARTALQSILEWMDARRLTSLETSTQIMILPGYRFRIISGLVTNFHQPQSTLLLLISAILGEEWKRVYAHALAGGYRFLSYGDANLYWVRK
jgi:S-adenosylmethionine:tRNA ribosyltransferase-isomerase